MFFMKCRAASGLAGTLSELNDLDLGKLTFLHDPFNFPSFGISYFSMTVNFTISELSIEATAIQKMQNPLAMELIILDFSFTNKVTIRHHSIERQSGGSAYRCIADQPAYLPMKRCQTVTVQ